mgnify:CR=1 FL=1
MTSSLQLIKTNSETLNSKIEIARLTTGSILNTQNSISKTYLSTGITSLDRMLGGGLPMGTISELTGSLSNGKTSVLFTLLAKATSEHLRIAYIDVFNTLDPHFARISGIQLKQLFWIHFRKEPLSNKLNKSLKSANILTRSQNFDVIVLDLETASVCTSEAKTQKIPFHYWFRIKKALHQKKIAFILLSHSSSAGSAATVRLGLKRSSVWWKSTQAVSKLNLSNHYELLRGFTTRVSLLKGGTHDQIKIYCHLQS